MSDEINIPIRTSTNKNKYGFISENSRVHNNANLSEQSYGADNFGEKGLGNHDNLKSIFSHGNSIINNDKDKELASAFLQGRKDLSGKSLTEEIEAAQRIIGLKLEERQAELDRQTPRGNPDEDVVFQNLLEDQTVLGKIQNNETNDPEALSALLVTTEFEYNPDFPLSNVNFGYGTIDTETSRAKDLHNRSSAVPTSPNINFPSLNSDFSNNEASANATTDVKGLNGSGGFGSSQSSNYSTPYSIITTIINRYI